MLKTKTETKPEICGRIVLTPMATQHDKNSMSFVAIGLGALALGLGAYYLFKPKAAAASPAGGPDFLKAADTTNAPPPPAGQMNVFGGVWDGAKWAQGPMLLKTDDASSPAQTIQTDMQGALTDMQKGGANLKTVIPAGSVYYEWGVDSKHVVVGTSKWDPAANP